MIKRIQIQNFKCLHDVIVDLGPFNVLIGPNDSGKTSFLEAIRLLGRTTTTFWGGKGENFNTPPFTNLDRLVWQQQRDLSVRYKVNGQIYHPFDYDLSLRPEPPILGVESLAVNGVKQFDSRDLPPHVSYKGWNVGGGPPIHTYLSHFADQDMRTKDEPCPALDVATDLRSSELYHFNPNEMRLQAKAEVSPTLNTSGSNLAANLLALLAGSNRQSIVNLETKLHDAIPTLKGVATPLVNANEGKHEIRFTLSENSQPSISIPSSQASDGAILVIGYLVLAYGNSPQILLVEEPENGLHPSLLKMVIDLLRKISTGEIGDRPRQVILTTHSPLLLNFVKSEEVRIFRRDAHQATQVTPMSNVPNIDKLQKEFAPGELWYLFGEEDLVKGQVT